MKYKEFYNYCMADPQIECLGMNIYDNQFHICYIPNDVKFTIGFEDIAKNNWDILKKVIYGEREPIVLEHFTRIVGYYSKTSNWNKSKMAELKDRQKGTYNVTKN